MKKQIVNVFLAAALVFVLAATAMASNAGYRIKVAIPFEFMVGSNVCAPGEYVIEQTAPRDVLWISGQQVQASVRTMAMPVAKPGSKTSLVFKKYGERYFLNQVWSSTREAGLKVPKTRQERELSKSGAHQTVVLAAAK